MGQQKYGVDPSACEKIASEVIELSRAGVQVAIVIGGGNIFRGIKAHQAGMARTPADHIGMLATLINGISLQQALETLDCESRILSAISCDTMAEPYSWKKALGYLDGGLVVIFVGGTGNPYFTTDSAAALRAFEIEAEVLIKATKVDGIYSEDPMQHPKTAVKYERISYSDILTRKLNVMDAAAIALCRENRLPIRVMNIFGDRNLKRAVFGENIGTLVEEREP